MKNKIIAILLVVILMITAFALIPLQSKAFTDPTENPSVWKPKEDTSDSTQYKSMVKNIVGYINVIGVVISVIILMVLGIKYMLGTVEEKAEYKKTMMGYVIGALMIFSTTTIANILYSIGLSIAQ